MRSILISGLAVLWPVIVAADNLPADAAVFDELVGVRSLAMGGAHRGVGTSNDTVYLNPAGMAIGRRYTIDFNYGYSPFSDLSHFNVSVVDSKSGPVAGALAYTFTRGDSEGVDATLHRMYAAVAYPLSDVLALGITLRHIRGDFVDGDDKREVELYGGDVGVMARVGGLGIGVTAHNVIKEEVQRLMPLTFGMGASYSTGVLAVASDLVYSTVTEDIESVHVGGEYFVANAFPMRLGYTRMPFTNRRGEEGSENLVTAGAGWVSPNLAVGISFQRSIERPRHWGVVTSLQLFM